jgi:peptidoglycan/LPS O-acetylase OafA/YrhL
VRGEDKILCLESLRGLAALAVATTHFRIGSTFNNRFTDNAGLMVDFFFVLSGFVMALSYQDKIRSLTHVYLFQARRFLRLYPLHVLMLIVFLGIEALKYLAEIKVGLLPNNPAFEKNDLWSFIQNLFLIQNLVSPDFSWNFPSWSISSEFCTYLIFAFAVLLSFGRTRQLVVMSLVLSSLSFFYLIYDLALLPNNGVIRCTYGFFLGVVIYNFTVSHRGTIPSVVSYVLFAAAIAATSWSDKLPPFLYWCIPVLFGVLLASLAGSTGESRLKRILNNRVLVHLGTISYGVYMVHALVWWMFSLVLRFGFGYESRVDAAGITDIVIGNVALSNLIMVLGLSVIILLGHLSYKLVEGPVNNFRHKLGRME